MSAGPSLRLPRTAAPTEGSGAGDIISVPIDLTNTPTPQGIVSVVAGETWHFQYWYRDFNGGAVTSNFSSALRLQFTN